MGSGSNNEASSRPFAVVGIGASAGGPEFLRRMLATLPADGDGLACVIAQHQEAGADGVLVEMLTPATAATVVEVVDGTELRTGHVYVTPANRSAEVRDGKIHLVRAEAAAPRSSADTLFRSLAREYGEHAVAVVLSGLGSDGAAGVRAVAQARGLCVAQDPSTTDYPSMPAAAIDTGLVQLVAAPEDLLDQIRRLLTLDGEDEAADPAFGALLDMVREESGVEFRHYKPNTLLRRIARRRGILGIESLEDYAQRVREDGAELERLSRDLLIGVTSFFRDAEVFAYLRRSVLPALVEAAGERGELRVWVPACATGEEAYSLAMLLLDLIADGGHSLRLQVFASDLDPASVAFARAGVYPESAAAEIGNPRVGRYFTRRDDGRVAVSGALRDVVVFAQQNVLADPPFSRIDLISCRNLLIYLKPEAQQRILDVFHFSLRPDGVLLLGSSESVGREQTRFQAASPQFRVFRRVGSERGALPPVSTVGPAWPPRSESQAQPPPDPELRPAVHRWLTERFAPAAVVLDRSQRAVFFSHTAHRFLRVPEGEPTGNLYDMLEPSASARLRAMVSGVLRSGEGVGPRPLVLRKSSEDSQLPIEASVSVLPFQIHGRQDLLVVTFREVTLANEERLVEFEKDEFVAQLERELEESREDLRRTVEDMDAANEALKASHEEAMSVNEELQSANEELETSKEELQSLNEELTTVNGQLRDKLDEVEEVNNDIANLLASTDLGVLFLDRRLHIKRYTPTLADLFRVAPSDVGRHVGDITRRFSDPDLERDAKRVLERVERAERQIVADDGRVFQQRILPYKTADQRIDGVVVTYTDVTHLQQTVARLDRARQQQAALARLSQLALTADDLQVVFDHAVRLCIRALDADFAKVLKLLAPEGPVLLVSGVGWRPGLVGVAEVGTEMSSQAGYTLSQGGTVVVENLDSETRFSGPELLTSHGVKSGISCPIEVAGSQWGVLGIHSRAVRNFPEQDADFVTSVASVLGQAIRVRQAADELRTGAQRMTFALEAAQVGTWLYRAADGTVVWSEQEHALIGTSPTDVSVSVDTFFERLHPEDHDRVRELIQRSIADRTEFRADFRVVLPSGQVRWLHGAGATFEDAGGKPLMYGVNFDITERKRGEALLEEAKRELAEEADARGRLAEERLQEIRRMSHEMIITESTERRRLAADLHDNLGQILNLARMRLSVLRAESPEADERLSQLHGLIQQAVDATRSITGQLSPQVLDELGLPPAIDWLAEEIERLYGLEVQVLHMVDPEGLSREQELIAYRSVRELLINVAKHARVRHAEVRLLREAGSHRIEVRDAGVGFEPKQALKPGNGGHGLFAVKERLSHVGGRLTLESGPGRGSIAIITLPADERESPR